MHRRDRGNARSGGRKFREYAPVPLLSADNIDSALKDLSDDRGREYSDESPRGDTACGGDACAPGSYT